MKTHVFFRILRGRAVSFQNKKPHVFFPQKPRKFYEIARFLRAQKHYCEPNAPKTNWTIHIKVYGHAVIVCKFMVPQFALCSVALRFWRGLWQLWQTTNRKGQFVIHVFYDDPMFSFLRHLKHPVHSGRVTLSHTKHETAFLAMIQLILTSTTWTILDFGNQQFHRTPWISMAADLQASPSGWNNFFKPTETAIFKINCLVAQFYY